jgi:hypothetical protein
MVRFGSPWFADWIERNAKPFVARVSLRPNK